MRKMAIIVPAVLLTLPLFACETGSADGPGGSVLGDVKVGETLHLDGDYKTIDVSLIEVSDDRCPSDLECSANGLVGLSLRIKTTRAGTTDDPVINPYLMSINPENLPVSFRSNGVMISIFSVDPTPRMKPTISQIDYSVGIRITDIFGP